MATLHEYYEKDFDYTFRFHVTIPYQDGNVEGSALYDFTSYSTILSCYFPGILTSAKYISGFIDHIAANLTVQFDKTIQLPSIKGFHGDAKVHNTGNQVAIKIRSWGDPVWENSLELNRSSRIYFYVEASLTEVEIKALRAQGEKHRYHIQFRNSHYQRMRDQHEAPYAFISHDSRDKQTIAKDIAVGLQKRLCPVWYDEFSLKVGDNLRESIETGIKKCKKCVLIISPNFIDNNGWSKKEFESIFSRELIKNENIFLPVWFNVTKEQVYEYSPGLVNILGLNYSELGLEETCRKLYLAVNN